MAGLLGAIWGVGGYYLLLGWAIVRLSHKTLEAFEHPLGWIHWAVLVPWVLFMAYSEGYKGFQKSFSPRMAARVLYLRHHPTLLRVLLAPLFCVGFFHARRRRLIAVYVLAFFIIGAIVLMQQIAQPWRGLLDLGVVVGLAWGLLSLTYFLLLATRGDFPYSPELPEPTGPR